MSDFNKYLSSLPKPLDKKEQEFLFYEYAKTKDENIRQKLIEHNLRLAAKFAYDYCLRNNMLGSIEDINSECVIGLVRAVDEYDVSKGIAFYTFAKECINYVVLNDFIKRDRDALSISQDLDFYNRKEDEDIKEGFLELFFDETESHISEDVASDEFVKDVLKFIDNLDNEKMKLAIKMYCGIDGYKKHNQYEIAVQLDVKQGYVSRLITHGQRLIRKFISSNYPNVYPNENKVISFKTIEERNEYIVNLFYGINCDKKSYEEIATEVGVTSGFVNYTIKNFQKTLSEEEIEKYQSLRSKQNRNKKWTDDKMHQLINQYYGINGCEVHSSRELMGIYNIKSKSAFSSRLAFIVDKFIKEGVYTREQVVEFQKNRKHALVGDVEKYAYEYYSYYGLNGYEKKSLLQLARESATYHQLVVRHIKKYESYLQGKQEEKGQN